MSEYIKVSDIRTLVRSTGNGEIAKIDNLGTQDLSDLAHYCNIKVLDLVRCKDCRYYNSALRECRYISHAEGLIRFPWDFCSRGRRK